MAESNQRASRVMCILSAIILLLVAAVHLYFVFTGTGGWLGVAFTLNGIAGVVLAIAVVVLRGRLLQLATVLSLLFVIATLLALIVSLTIGLFGVHETWDAPLVAQTVVLESIGIVILAITTAIVLRRPSTVQATTS